MSVKIVRSSSAGATLVEAAEASTAATSTSH